MLKSLRIKNFAIIEETELHLSKGLTVLTGETGAGKSILLDAMGLILGNRSDSSMVRHGTKKADITAQFDLSEQQAIKNHLESLDLETEDKECIIRRVVHNDGKSKAYINGTPCTVSSLKQVVSHLVDIHGQHDHQLLIHNVKQLSWLDEQLPNKEILITVSESYKNWLSAKNELDNTLTNQQQQTEDLDRFQFLLQELENLNPQENEFQKIENEHKQQANAEDLINHAQKGYELLSQGKNSITSQLSDCLLQFKNIESLDKDSGISSTFIDQALIELEDQSNTIKNYYNTIEIDPQQLSYLETRISGYENLAFKHHCSSEKLHLKTEELKFKIENIQNADENLEKLQQKVVSLATEYLSNAQQLSDSRFKTASSLSQSISGFMQQLSMAGGEFKIDIQNNTKKTFSSKGQDEIQFLVSANPGQPLKPLKKVASGGELSRISLAMQLVTNSKTRIATLIFDEVDAGIGGETANVVGKLLRQLGTNTQSLCVTHLPQVASNGHNHLIVKKSVIDNQTHTHLLELNQKERTNEIARMLAGDLTESSIQHANELLNNIN